MSSDDEQSINDFKVRTRFFSLYHHYQNSLRSPNAEGDSINKNPDYKHLMDRYDYRVKFRTNITSAAGVLGLAGMIFGLRKIRGNFDVLSKWTAMSLMASSLVTTMVIAQQSFAAMKGLEPEIERMLVDPDIATLPSQVELNK